MNNKPAISLYWKCQLIGWSAAALYWGYIGYTGTGFNIWLGLLYFVSDVLLYILITHAYRTIALHYGWNLLPAKKLVAVLVPAVLVLGVLFMLGTVLKIYWLRQWFIPGFSVPLPVFFQQNWLPVLMAGFRLMAIWLLAYHLYHYAQREIRIEKENARLTIINRDVQLNNLSAQLNPHFLFNSLNNIKSLVAEDPVKARRAIDLLADLLRTSLYHGDTMLIPLREELEIVTDYLELEQLRMEERLQIEINVDNSAHEIPVPRLSIQLLVENAIKHGIEKQKHGGLISIRAIKKEGVLEIDVQNSGSLNVPASANGVGLVNLKERLQLQYKGDAYFSINEQVGNRVLATIIIPIA
ncbi:MAG: histidine kinase [Chitinophagaceae bacterium]